MQVVPSPADAAAIGTASRPAADARWRLTIGQLLLVMATTGLVLAFLQAYDPSPSAIGGAWDVQGQQRLARLDWIVHRLFAPAYGTILAGTAVVLRRLALGQEQCRREPGHWMLPILAGWSVCLAIFVVNSEAVWEAGPRAALFLVSAAMVVVGTLTATAAWHLREPAMELWYAAFMLQAIVAGAMASAGLIAAATENQLLFWMAVGFFLLGGSTVVLAGLIAALAIFEDLAAARDRDGLHWIGVGSLLLVGSHPLILMLVRAAA